MAFQVISYHHDDSREVSFMFSFLFCFLGRAWWPLRGSGITAPASPHGISYNLEQIWCTSCFKLKYPCFCRPQMPLATSTRMSHTFKLSNIFGIVLTAMNSARGWHNQFFRWYLRAGASGVKSVPTNHGPSKRSLDSEGIRGYVLEPACRSFRLYESHVPPGNVSYRPYRPGMDISALKNLYHHVGIDYCLSEVWLRLPYSTARGSYGCNLACAMENMEWDRAKKA